MYRLTHLEHGEGGIVPDPVGLGGLLVIDPDQSDSVSSNILPHPLQDTQHSVTCLAVFRIYKIVSLMHSIKYWYRIEEMYANIE